MKNFRKAFAGKLRTVLIFLGLLLVLDGFAQPKTVTGVVVSARDKTPLVGVSVIVEGTTTGTSTDRQGAFSLRLPEGRSRLTVSMLGYKPRQIECGARTQFEIALEEDAIGIETVLVPVGYGYAPKHDLTGSVASIIREDIEGRVATSVDDLLRGRVAGMRITAQDGAPGAAVSISLRGGTSISASSEPLYVIDGFPVLSNSSDLNAESIGGIGSNTNPLADLNPEDIESINILKDASATAIYGSRGANGVVIITTKQPEAGKVKVSYSGHHSVIFRPEETEVLSTEEFNVFQNEKNNRYASSPRGSNIYNAEKWATYTHRLDSLRSVDWRKQPDTDWQREIYRAGYNTKHQVSLTGGNKTTKYIANVDYNRIEGVVKNTDFSRFSGRLQLDQQITKWLSFTTNNRYSHSVHNGITQASGGAGDNSVGIFLRALRYNPGLKVNDESFYENGDTDADMVLPPSNPYVLIRDAVRQKTVRSFTSNNMLSIRLADGLVLKSSFGVKSDAVNQKQYYGRTTGLGRQVNGRASISAIDVLELLNENTLNYTKTFNRVHSLNAMGGMTFQTNKRKIFTANARNFPYDGMGADNLGVGTEFVRPTSEVRGWQMASILGRVNYAYDHRYLLTASIRADGSSRLAEGHKWDYFPSVALAWRLSQEQFLRYSPVVSNLKLRASYGRSGNQEIGLYRSLRIYAINTPAFNDAITNGIALSNVGNDNLKWEKTDELNLGLDLGLFNDRVTVSADYYYKVTRDLLLNVATMPSSGFSTTMMNIGKVSNEGVEVVLSAEILRALPRQKKLGWTFDFNIAHNKNRVLSLGTTNEFFRSVNYFGTATDQVIVRVGEPLGTWYGYKTDGIFQYGDPDLDRFTSVQGNTPAAGDWKYVDRNHDDKIDEDDRMILGNSRPLFFGGFSTAFTYRGFQLRFMFEYSYGAKIFNANRVSLEDMASYENLSRAVLGRWVGPDFDAQGNPVAGTGNPTNEMPRAGYASTYQMQDNFLEDGSYLRLSNIKLSYALPQKFTKKLGMRSASVYLSAQNVWLWTGYSGSDPEVNIDPSGYGNMIAGYDYDAYPRSTSVTVGLNINF